MNTEPKVKLKLRDPWGKYKKRSLTNTGQDTESTTTKRKKKKTINWSWFENLKFTENGNASWQQIYTNMCLVKDSCENM